MVSPGQSRAHDNGASSNPSADQEISLESPLYAGLLRMDPGPSYVLPINPRPGPSSVAAASSRLSSANSGSRVAFLDQEPSLLSCLNLGPSNSSSPGSCNSVSEHLGPSSSSSSSMVSSAKRKCVSNANNSERFLFPKAMNFDFPTPSEIARLTRMAVPKLKSRVSSFPSRFIQVPTLTYLAMEFIVGNLQHVKLVGAPVEVLKVILQACTERGVFSQQNRNSEIAFDTFLWALRFHAVGHLVLSGVYLRPYIAQHDAFLISSLRFVTDLDMSNCCLVDDEILLSFSVFEHLQILNLANNYLSKEGLRMFLVRHELFKDGFKSLRILNLRYSHLFHSNLSTILTFPKLQQLQFSVCTDGLERKHVDLAPSAARVTFFVPIPASAKTVEEIIHEAGFKYNQAPPNFSIQDKGFLIPTLKRWMEEFPQTCKSPRQFGGKELLCRRGVCTEDGMETVADEQSVFLDYCAFRH